jgi:predicted RNase H-like HicB family nuclease
MMDYILVYNAIFTYDEDGISVYFPDLPGCITCGYSTDEAIQMAKEALELYLDDIKIEDLPKCSEINQIQITGSNQKIFPIEVKLSIK